MPAYNTIMVQHHIFQKNADSTGEFSYNADLFGDVALAITTKTITKKG
jgi:hypothetical protein